MQDLDACDGVDTTTSPTTITATRMGRSVELNTAAAEIARASGSKNFKSAKVVNTSGAIPGRIALGAGGGSEKSNPQHFRARRRSNANGRKLAENFSAMSTCPP
jgi:hypothetical protein